MFNDYEFVKNKLHLSDEDLMHLATSTEPIYRYIKFELKQECVDIFTHANGFFVDKVVFSYKPINSTDDEKIKYFMFLRINYLDESNTFTVPYEVFKSIKTDIRTTYSNAILVDENLDS